MYTLPKQLSKLKQRARKWKRRRRRCYRVGYERWWWCPRTERRWQGRTDRRRGRRHLREEMDRVSIILISNEFKSKPCTKMSVAYLIILVSRLNSADTAWSSSGERNSTLPARESVWCFVSKKNKFWRGSGFRWKFLTHVADLRAMRALHKR